MMMKKYIYIILVLSFKFSFAQKEQAVYLKFDSKSEESCQIQEKDKGRYHNNKKQKKYIKNKSSSKDYSYRFYICKELFLAYKKIDTCNIKYLNNIKISKLIELKKVVEKTNPLYPEKIFPNLYLVEKINDSTIIKYKVKWKYYIE